MSGLVPARIVALVLGGGAAITAIAWHGGALESPGSERGTDFVPPSPAALALEAARATGDVFVAVPLLDEAIATYGPWAGLVRHRASLERERAAAVAADPSTLTRLRELGSERAHADEVVELILRLVPADDEVRGFFARARSAEGLDARAAQLSNGAPDVARASELANAFAAAGRQAAALRWQLRAFASAPNDPRRAEPLARACLAVQRQDAAHAVLAAAIAAGADDPGLWTLRATVASWTGALRAEAEALTHVAASTDELKRLGEVQLALGRPDLAWSPLAAAARSAGAHDDLLHAAAVAAAADRVDDAVALLSEARPSAADPVDVDLEIAELLRNDVRPQAAVAHLEARIAASPDPRLRARRDALQQRLGQYPEPAPEPLTTSDAAPVAEPDAQAAPAVLPTHSPAAELFLSLARPAVLTDPPSVKAAVDLAVVARLSPAEWGDVRMVLADQVRDARVRPVFAALLATHIDLPGTRESALWFADTAASPAETAALAASFAARMPADAAWLVAWAERASWAGLSADEIRAREALRLTTPHDTANVVRLAELYAAVDRIDDAITTQRGLPVSAEQRAILAEMLARKGDDTAITELVALSAQMDADSRFALAERLLGVRRIDEALALHVGILFEQPDHVGSLRRTAQLRSWGNDAEGALPHLDRLIALEPDGEALYLRGEANYATQRDAPGRADFERALPLLRQESATDPQRKRMLAAVLAKLDQPDEAQRLFEELVADAPQDLHLHLDYAGSMFSTGRYDVTRDVLRRAHPLGPGDQRLLRLDGALALEEQRFADAERSLNESLALHGRDAGVLSDLGSALRGQGALRGAVDALTESLARQPDNLSVRTFRRQIADLLPHPTIETHVASRALADDERFGIRVEGATATSDDRTRLGAVISRDQFVGRARALRRGRKDARATIEALGLGATRRVGDEWTVGGGLDVYRGRPDADDAGGWAEVARRTRGPYSSLSLRLHTNEVWDDPIAAAALGGRTHGARVEWYVESPEAWWWLSGRAQHRNVGFEHPHRGHVSDPEWSGEVSVGRQFLRDGPMVNQRLQPRHAPVAEAGTTVAHEPSEARGPRVSAWLSYSGLRVRGGADVAGPVPYSERFDYVSLTAHATQTLVPGLHVDAEAFYGRDLYASATVGAVSAGLAWRPDEHFEVRLGGRYGQALGRGASSDGATDIELAVVVRW